MPEAAGFVQHRKMRRKCRKSRSGDLRITVAHGKPMNCDSPHLFDTSWTWADRSPPLLVLHPTDLVAFLHGHRDHTEDENGDNDTVEYKDRILPGGEAVVVQTRVQEIHMPPGERDDGPGEDGGEVQAPFLDVATET